MTERSKERIGSPVWLIDGVRLAMAPHVASIGPARNIVTEMLDGHEVSDEAAQDILIVASELLTNAVQQNTAAPVLLEVRQQDAGCLIRVTNERLGDSSLPPRDEWRPDHLLAPRGRGLGIVDILCADVDVEEADETISVAATYVGKPGTVRWIR